MGGLGHKTRQNQPALGRMLQRSGEKLRPRNFMSWQHAFGYKDSGRTSCKQAGGHGLRVLGENTRSDFAQLRNKRQKCSRRSAGC